MAKHKQTSRRVATLAGSILADPNMDNLQAALKKHEIRNTKSETNANAGKIGKLETKRRFEQFHRFRISRLFRVSSFDFRISRLARWLLLLAGAVLAWQVANVALFALIIWRLQAVNLW